MPDGSELSGCYRINPTIPISAESTAITGITDADVADCKTFKELAPEIFKLFQGSDIAGYNSNNFDPPSCRRAPSRRLRPYCRTSPLGRCAGYLP